jgi:heat-inducible transcriptional repressor
VRETTAESFVTDLELTKRQQMVLRAVVAAYVAEATPTSSRMVSHLLPVPLSSASIRNTMAELAGLGLIAKPHASAGRIPTERGLRQFVDQLLETGDLPAYDRRSLQTSFADAPPNGIMELVSQLLSERTHQLGFALTPRIERMRLRHVSLVRVATDRVLVVLVPQAGPTQQRIIEEPGNGDQAVLDRMATNLNERVLGHTLAELRRVLTRELSELRSEARSLLARSLALGLRVASRADAGDSDLVITSRLAVLSQPEFKDPERIRSIFAAVETNEWLIAVVDRLLDAQPEEVSVALGADLEESGLRDCALVAIPYGGTGLSDAGAEESQKPALAGPGEALGVLGVIGPSRMDYARIIPLVSYCSQLVTEKLNA